MKRLFASVFYFLGLFGLSQALEPHQFYGDADGESIQNLAAGRDLIVKKGEFEKGMKQVKLAADADNPEAQFLYGTLSFSGIRPDPLNQFEAKDPEGAKKYMKLAAENGHPVAMHNLAIWYRNGLAFKKDHEQAMLWAEKSALLGLIQGQSEYAHLLWKGEHEKDLKKAYAWFSLLVDQLPLPIYESYLKEVAEDLSADELKRAQELVLSVRKSVHEARAKAEGTADRLIDAYNFRHILSSLRSRR